MQNLEACADNKAVRVVVLRELEKPTIAAIHGFAFGVGLDLAMACNFRIAEASAVLRDQRVIERGMHAVTGCAWFHPRVMGVARALEFLILGEPLTGEQAAEPPDPGAYEITDKGYVNQSAVQSHRRKAVEALFAATPGPDVIET